jgi:hypothetical protein
MKIVMKEENKAPKHWISIRVKPDDYSTIYQLYTKTTCRKLSEYVRMVLLKEPVTVLYRNQSADEILTVLNQIKNELSAIGNNFNQSVKVLHSMRHFPEINTWAMLNESTKQILLNKIEETRLRMNQIYEQWSRK